MITKTLSFIVTCLLTQTLMAQALPVQGGTPEILKAISEHNAQQARADRAARKLGPVGRSTDTLTPFYEYGSTGYVAFSDDDFYGIAADMKATVARNLPADVELLVYTQSSSKSHQQSLKSLYSQYIDSQRVHILQVPQSGSNDFWSRDNLPLPIWKNGNMALADARYYYNFEPDAFFGQLFGVQVLKHNYFYEGGNFMANSRGDCLVVNRKKSYPGGVSDTAAIPDDIFRNYYGCKNLIRLKHLKGIGHADEVVKFISDDVVVSDTPEYTKQLEAAGFTVVDLPEADLNYETYVNSLIVNDVVYVPVFGESGDQKVLDTYTNLGFKAIPVQSRRLATQGQGGIHCITMNYPKMPLQEILQSLGAKVVQ